MSDQNPLQRIDITRDEIDTLVTVFYERIRAHPKLGPIFKRAIAQDDGPEWRAHEAKIAAFWRNAVGMDRNYQGNPMQIHRANRDVHPGMFSPWLALFHATAEDVIRPEAAAAIGVLAERIGKSLRYGVTTRDEVKGAPPVLR